MTDFMADRTADFVIGGDIHEAGEYTHAAVRHREGIHVGDQMPCS